jgi:hypothetical protein
LDLRVIEAHLRAARAASRVGAEPRAAANALKVDRSRVRAYRAAAMHLDERVPSLTAAAHAGLQDSAPRSALLSLYARARHVALSSWEDPSLVQIWFRLGADYVIPREDFAIFTLGALPRDDEQVRAFDQLGSMVAATTKGRPTRTRDVETALPGLPNRFLIRQSVLSGRVAIRWDARTTEVIAMDRPDVDLEDARRELARRFLHWMGPASSMHFARWAAVPKKEAMTTWDALDVVAVEVDGRARWMLESDIDALVGAERAAEVRLLPMGDPYLYLDTGQPPRVPEGVPPRVVNSLGGRILLDCELVGGWARTHADVTLFAWTPLSRTATERVEAEASGFGPLLGKAARVRWLG